MSTYRMTPARRAALEKAQAASAAKRRKNAKRSRISRLSNRKTLSVVAVSGIAAGLTTQQIIAHQRENAIMSDPISRLIIARHVNIARYQNFELNRLRAPQQARTFNEEAARREAIRILKKKKMRKRA